MRRVMFSTAVVSVALFAAALAGQSRDQTATSSDCAERGRSNREVYCDVREATLSGANPLDVDTGGNGGITVRGWDRGDVHMRARIVAHADTEAEARRIASSVRVDAAGGSIRVEGPRNDRDSNWSVNVEL